MKNDTCWIDVIDEQDADESLSSIYQKVRAPNGQLDNLYRAFSLRAHTIIPADDLYRAALHNDNNTLPKVLSELIGTFVACLTGCDYAAAHHGANYRHLVGSMDDAERVLNALRTDDLAACGDAKTVAVLEYTRQLCLAPDTVKESDLVRLRKAGWPDGEILEIVQVVAMFSYFVRVINGIGITLGDEKLGLY